VNQLVWRRRQGGDAANVILTAIGCNLRLVLARPRSLLRLILLRLCRALIGAAASNGLLSGRLIEIEFGFSISAIERSSYAVRLHTASFCIILDREELPSLSGWSALSGPFFATLRH
jgi:hypothetical protein